MPPVQIGIRDRSIVLRLSVFRLSGCFSSGFDLLVLFGGLKKFIEQRAVFFLRLIGADLFIRESAPFFLEL